MGAHRRSSFRVPIAVVAALLIGLLVLPGTARAGLSPAPEPEAGTVPPTFDLAWGAFGGSSGQFNYPTGIDVAPNGHVYVADRANHRIQEFTSTGAYVAAWGANGNDPGQFHNPTDVAVDADGNVYVTDEGNHRIQKFTSTGSFLTLWGSQGSDDGFFVYPSGIVVTAGGEVYVTDSANHRVQRFTNTGTFLGKWGGPGSTDGLFNYPGGIAEAANGEILVADGNDRVQRFSPTGTFLGKWTSGFADPVSVDVDSEGDVYVSDQANHRIQAFTPTGTFLFQWGTNGTGDGQFVYPHGVAVGPQDSVYVVDHFNHRVQRFVPTPEPSLTVVKTADQTSVVVGDAIDYQVTVTNTGNQELTGVVLTDPNAPGCSGALGDLAVGGDPAVVECSYFTTAEDVGTYTNVASVDSYETEPVESDPVEVTVEAAPSLSVVKTADQAAVLVGEAIDYHVTVTNTGSQALTGVTITDPNAPACDGSVPELPVGGPPHVVDCSYTTTEADVGTYTNVATADSDETEPVASDPVDVTVDRVRPDAKIRKGTGVTVGNNIYNTTGANQTRTASVAAGGTATFTVKFQNDGTTADDFVIKGPASTTRFRVTYLVGGVDVTSQVTAGAYRFDDVPPGSSRTMTLTIKAKAGTPRGAVFTAKVKVTSDLDTIQKDVVKAVVTRV